MSEKSVIQLEDIICPKRTLSQLFEVMFHHPLLMALKRKLLERESCVMSRETNRIKRCVRDGGWYGGRCGGRGRWCCWRHWWGWGLWVRVWGFHALINPSSKETCREECVPRCRWHHSSSTTWVFKSSTFTIKLSIWTSFLAKHSILLG